LRFLAVSIAALALAVAASALQAPAAKEKAATSVGAKGKAVPHVAASAKSGTTKTGTAKSSTSKSRAMNTAASKSVASKSVASKSGSKTGVKSRRAVVARRPPTQQQPSTDRYKEIQQALADKGYFQGPVDGVWNAGSVEALKRFQKDQNLDPDGKIGSLSLIALGLGPKRAVASVQSAPTTSDPVDPPTVAQPQP
jgi:peptidoglycan hydrolase-like protein with peptidoglycan-binding domain